MKKANGQTKMIAAEWKAMAPEERAPYQEKYRAAKEKWSAFKQAGGVSTSPIHVRYNDE